MKRQHFLYIIASKLNGTLYACATSDLVRRTWKHKNKVHDMYVEVARREKRLKNWPREWKINLIEEMNPEWRDLFEEVCF